VGQFALSVKILTLCQPVAGGIRREAIRTPMCNRNGLGIISTINDAYLPSRNETLLPVSAGGREFALPTGNDIGPSRVNHLTHSK
jgi:hypothetical protein